VGQPTIAEFWAEGRYEIPTVTEAEEDSVIDPPVEENSFRGLTLSVETVGGVSLDSLLSRSKSLADSSCALSWISDNVVCGDLTESLTAAREALSHGDGSGARGQIVSILATLGDKHGPGLPINDNAYWLLKVNVEFILSHIPAGGVTAAVFLAGSGGTANPPTLSLSTDDPSGTTAKYKDSPAITFNGGNPWADVGTWTAAPALTSGTLTALGDAHVWLGLTNSDDIGTNFDLRVEAYRNGSLIASGLTRCIQSVTRNASQATEVAVPFTPVSATAFNGTTDVLTIKVVTRVGTTDTGELCGGHGNAVGVRVYFDAANRAAQLSATY
jgi:hypothetical protein